MHGHEKLLVHVDNVIYKRLLPYVLVSTGACLIRIAWRSRAISDIYKFTQTDTDETFRGIRFACTSTQRW